MLHSALEFLADVVVQAWPWGEKRWWKLSLVLAVALVASVVIFVMFGN